MYPAIIEWFSKNLQPEEFRNKRVLEVGSFDVNGSVRPLIEAYNPKEYIGIDIIPGPRVDLVLPAEKIVEHFGPKSFDAIISTETLEHVPDWRAFIINVKTAIKSEGYIYLTVCPPKMGVHKHPLDCWRFEANQIRQVFRDFRIHRLEGEIYIKAQKPSEWTPDLDLSTISPCPVEAIMP